MRRVNRGERKVDWLSRSDGRSACVGGGFAGGPEPGYDSNALTQVVPGGARGRAEPTDDHMWGGWGSAPDQVSAPNR